MGSWDGGGDTTPTLASTSGGTFAHEYWLTGGEIEDQGLGSGVATHVMTDQVRFYADDSTRPMNLDQVTALALSEVMRDVDLFVGVASSATTRSRRRRYRRPLPRLLARVFVRRPVRDHRRPSSTSSRSSFHLEDQGQGQTHRPVPRRRGQAAPSKIHLGSGNILMTPNDQYLCIVPDRSRPHGRLPPVRRRSDARLDPLEGVPAGRGRQNHRPDDHPTDREDAKTAMAKANSAKPVKKGPAASSPLPGTPGRPRRGEGRESGVADSTAATLVDAYHRRRTQSQILHRLRPRATPPPS